MRSVAMRPGNTTWAAIPSLTTSRDRVFDHPTNNNRKAFEIAWGHRTQRCPGDDPAPAPRLHAAPTVSDSDDGKHYHLKDLLPKVRTSPRRRSWRRSAGVGHQDVNWAKTVFNLADLAVDDR